MQIYCRTYCILNSHYFYVFLKEEFNYSVYFLYLIIFFYKNYFKIFIYFSLRYKYILKFLNPFFNICLVINAPHLIFDLLRYLFISFFFYLICKLLEIVLKIFKVKYNNDKNYFFTYYIFKYKKKNSNKKIFY